MWAEEDLSLFIILCLYSYIILSIILTMYIYNYIILYYFKRDKIINAI